jgi:hypothetical protein
MIVAGLAKKAYDMARRPENQARIQQATDRMRQGRAQPPADPGGEVR